DVAASGGYYIATPGRKIVAQSATLTGSIGVITAKAVTQGALAKVAAHRESIRMGANADLYDGDQPWSDGQRALVRGEIERIYALFTDRVAEGRQIERGQLEALCNGRVWSGRQALENGLVDALGDFHVAVDLACEAAGLPADGSVRADAVAQPKGYSVATAAQPPESWLDPGGLRESMRWIGALAIGDWERILGGERIWLIADGLPKI
ncbi:MAG: S49 family peptidase, partial [Caldilineaceae bacterium]|nr:S49 family peptidase [Caldilineaceae bacterium]